MVRTEEQRIRENEQQNARRAANPQKVRDEKNARYAANPQKFRDQANALYAADPQKRRDQANARYAADPQKFRDEANAYRQTPEGHKKKTIQNWRRIGLIDEEGDGYENLYNQYLQSSNCNACKCNLIDSRDMDHDHDTGLFRQVLCHRCNVYDYWKKYIDTPEDGFYLNRSTLLH